ncbi:DNA repair protein RecN [Alkalibacter mobilis]|uniref:DNA repair protein RecN n=1 Tax=Alkalibacter mobilis TaxID=2787712 RepID=UPI00189EF1F4|nr:DNA repair protein RecN [Alkalibacter mobilis]MBF7097118.1 DNA repair protein RecN [Alkalibacter mobilis]
MLAELNIKNYALIENLRIEFQKGFNVITGETGAGKSIIINALMQALGARGNKDMIKRGKERLVVQAIFTFEGLPEDISDLISGLGVDYENSGLILSREIHKSGRNVCRINDINITVNDLKKIGDKLVDIHSQRDHNLILNKEEHLKILDMYGKEKIYDILESVKELHGEWKRIKREKENLIDSIAKEERDLDIFRFQLKEISSIEFEVREDENLEKKINIMGNAEILFKNASAIYEILYGSDTSVQDMIGEALKNIQEMEKADFSLSQYEDRLNEINLNMEDIAYYFRDYREMISFDDSELNKSQDKLNKLNALKRKYGPELEDVLEFKKTLEENIDKLERKDAYLDEIEKKLLKSREAYENKSMELRKVRKEAGKTFADNINRELKALSMKDAYFSIIFRELNEEKNFAATGLDDVEFLIRTNRGDEDKPLIKIASGGEISRIMLAIKSVIGKSYGMKTLIFDEIDTGISGLAATSVGKKLKEISKDIQLISITHLPQIASMADNHFEVIKEGTSEGNVTRFKYLDFDQRVEALANMIDGGQTKKSLDHAREILSKNIK